MSIESTKKFADEIRRVIDYFASEFNMTYAEAIGVLQMIIMDIHAESWEGSEGEEDKEDGEHFEESDP